MSDYASEYGGYGDESNYGGGADYGNGGYNDTSNNEGGFQSSSQNSQSTPGGSKKRKNQSSCTCTISQVLSSKFDEDTSTYMLDGEPIGTCVFIGEIINLEDSATTTKLELEHVTPFIWGNSQMFKLGVLNSDVDYSNLRWTLDNFEDFKLIKWIYSQLYSKNNYFNMFEVIKLLEKNKQVLKTNNHLIGKEGYEIFSK